MMLYSMILLISLMVDQVISVGTTVSLVVVVPRSNREC
jgi:hypothetical protein